MDETLLAKSIVAYLSQQPTGCGLHKMELILNLKLGNENLFQKAVQKLKDQKIIYELEGQWLRLNSKNNVNEKIDPEILKSPFVIAQCIGIISVVPLIAFGLLLFVTPVTNWIVYASLYLTIGWAISSFSMASELASGDENRNFIRDNSKLNWGFGIFLNILGTLFALPICTFMLIEWIYKKVS